MLAWFDWLMFVIVVAGLAARAWFGMRALRRLDPADARRERPRLWARAILSQWVLVAVLVALWLVRRRDFGWLELRMPSAWGLGGVLLGVALMLVMVRAQRGQVASDPGLAGRVRDRLRPVEALMPHAREEWPGFVSVAVTAGICEEILFRGFVTWALAHVLPAYWMAALAQALLFGLAHAYQGPRGVLATAAVGAFLSGLVWVSGSLWAAMLVHALMDLHAGDLALRVLGPPGPPAANA